MSTQWLDNIQIAMIEKEFETLVSLCENLPEFQNVQELEEASRLIHESITLLRKEQKACHESMMKIRKNSAFLSHEKVHARLHEHA